MPSEDPTVAAWGRITRKARSGLGLNQREFADLLGVTPKAIRDWEHERKLPRAEHRRRLGMLAREVDENAA